MNQEYPSTLLERAVKEFSKLPGIGRKTATRLVLHLLRKKEEEVEAFSSAIITLKREAKYCKECHSISDTDICPICANPLRDHSVICVVENIQDVMAVAVLQALQNRIHLNRLRPVVQRYRRVMPPRSASWSVCSVAPRLHALSRSQTTLVQVV